MTSCASHDVLLLLLDEAASRESKDASILETVDPFVLRHLWYEGRAELCSYGLQTVGTPPVTQLDHISYLGSEKMLSFPGVKNLYISLPTPIIRLS